MKFATDHPFADPDVAARKLVEIANGWLWRHESGLYVKFTATGADLFA
jgi:hypothetical protein